MRSCRASARAISVGVVHVVRTDDQVEIAVADMADHRGEQAAVGEVALGLLDALGQPRDRHADIRRQAAPWCRGAAPGRQ
jgi:hypothetical protein